MFKVRKMEMGLFVHILYAYLPYCHPYTYTLFMILGAMVSLHMSAGIIVWFSVVQYHEETVLIAIILYSDRFK